MNSLTDTLEPRSVAPATTGSQDVIALAGRLLLATLFILAGVNKIGAAEGTIGYIASVGLPFAEPAYYATVAHEIVGGLLRGGRFLDGIDARPLPFTGSSRRIVLCATGDWSGDIPRQIAAIARDLIEQHFTERGLDMMPWLQGQFRILPEE